MRRPSFAGSFYEADPVRLDAQIKACFTHPLGPGGLPGPPKDLPLRAAVVPHAGYIFSGPCAAWAYKALAEAPLPDVVVVAGPNHSASVSGLTIEPVEMPFGFVRVDQELAHALAAREHIAVNEDIQPAEHSVEVQLPFLQFIYRAQIERLKVLPLLLSIDCDLRALARDLKDALFEQHKTAVFVVSSDFTHHGPRYSYAPYADNVAEQLAALNHEALDAVLRLDDVAFRRHLATTGNTICGHIPLTLLMFLITPMQARLEAAYASGDIVDDWTNTVSYASLTYR